MINVEKEFARVSSCLDTLIRISFKLIYTRYDSCSIDRYDCNLAKFFFPREYSQNRTV